MVAQPLEGREVATAVATVVALYGGAIFSLHRWAAEPPSVAGVSSDKPSGFWGTLPSAWDHPEPNYVVSGVIGEFWSVLTTIPIAGTLLLYEGVRFGYGTKVMCIFALTCCMYSLAFMAHLTLQMHIFSTTVIAVMSNALLTFAMFSNVVHWALASKLVRGLIVAFSELLLVGTVATLPYAIEHGGVWTLFTVQSPGVFLATFLATVMAWNSRCEKERLTYQLVGTSGGLLSTAMVLSLVECLIGFQHGYLEDLWGFPWLHIAIHVLEQVGIYVFGVGVAALQALLVSPEAFHGAEVRTVCGMVYLYCPTPAKFQQTVEARKPAVSSKLKGSPAGSPEDRRHRVTGKRPSIGEADQEIQTKESRSETSLQRRKRTQSPGVSGLIARKMLKPPVL